MKGGSPHYHTCKKAHLTFLAAAYVRDHRSRKKNFSLPKPRTDFIQDLRVCFFVCFYEGTALSGEYSSVF